MSARIRYTAEPIRDILAQAAGDEEFRPLPFVAEAAARMRVDTPPGEAWDAALRSAGCSCGLREADRQLIRDFGGGLGRSDVEGQLSHCEAFAQLLDDRLQTARSEAASKGKLYITLGAAAGLCTALLLL